MLKHKKVELTELFYDLVFVYGFSQQTALIHHVHDGIVPFVSFFAFVIGMVTMINSWMVQTVFTNRFGKNSLTNIFMMFAQMALLLITLTSVTGEFSHRNFIYFYLPIVGISFILLVQYIIEYLRSRNEGDKVFVRRFFYILGARTLGLLIAVFLPYRFGLGLAALSILVTWLLPGFLTKRKYMAPDLRPINFPHLVERLSLLVIITFGEMIIGIADYFSPERLSLLSVCIFFIVASLFMIYIVEIDHMIDVDLDNPDGNHFIYWHYPIFFGLSFVTVSLGFLGNEEANNGFATLLLYLGIAMLMIGIYQLQPMNKVSHYFTPKLLLGISSVWLMAVLLSLVFLKSSANLIVIGSLATLIMAVIAVVFNLRHLSDTPRS
ncbi:low temperature requirement protein A [Streptococcus merionis]|uniref:low temperature requirement protein A n=1 Tax=Streptococcus merionis TaxID=400065 RepID=UPI0026E9FCEF|nr:low temperature requirement protein A [Streptococcus merionis]